MDAVRVTSAKQALVRHRRVAAVVGALDVAVTLMFILFQSGDYSSWEAWVDQKVIRFMFNDSLFDLLLLSLLRFLLLVLYSLDLWFFGLFAVPLFFCLVSLPYTLVKAIFYGFANGSWESKIVIGSSMLFALIETVLMLRGMQLHLRRLARSQVKGNHLGYYSLNDEDTSPLIEDREDNLSITGPREINVRVNTSSIDKTLSPVADSTFITPPESPTSETFPDPPNASKKLHLLSDFAGNELSGR